MTPKPTRSKISTEITAGKSGLHLSGSRQTEPALFFTIGPFTGRTISRDQGSAVPHICGHPVVTVSYGQED